VESANRAGGEKPSALGTYTTTNHLGIAADAVIVLANIPRRVNQDFAQAIEGRPREPIPSSPQQRSNPESGSNHRHQRRKPLALKSARFSRKRMRKRLPPP
jgi:hypothetical protein